MTHHPRFRSAAVVAAIACLPACSDAPPGRIDAWAERATRKLAPDAQRDPAHGSADQVVLEAALGEWEPASADELARVVEALMVALGRIQAAIDAIVPWSDLDRVLELRRAP